MIKSNAIYKWDNHIIYHPNWVTVENEVVIINDYVKKTDVLSWAFTYKTFKKLLGTNKWWINVCSYYGCGISCWHEGDDPFGFFPNLGF